MKVILIPTVTEKPISSCQCQKISQARSLHSGDIIAVDDG